MNKKILRYFDIIVLKNFSNPDYWITIMGVSTISGGAMTSVAAKKYIDPLNMQTVNNNKALLMK